MSTMIASPVPTRVFISYSHDSPEHAERVLELANRLRREGVDAWLDRFDPHPPDGWPLWMEREIERAAFVLLVCTPTYYRRFAGEEKPGVGHGASWEGKLLRTWLYRDRGRNERAVPVVFDGASDEVIPLPLRDVTRYRLPDDYDRLYRRLTDQPEVTAEPIGAIRDLDTPPDPEPLAAIEPRSAGVVEDESSGEPEPEPASERGSADAVEDEPEPASERGSADVVEDDRGDELEPEPEPEPARRWARGRRLAGVAVAVVAVAVAFVALRSPRGSTEGPRGEPAPTVTPQAQLDTARASMAAGDTATARRMCTYVWIFSPDDELRGAARDCLRDVDRAEGRQ